MNYPLPITVMPEMNNQTEYPIFNALDIPQDGQRVRIGVIEIREVEQMTYDKESKAWSKKMETVTKFNPKTGKTNTVTSPVKGFVINFYIKEDPDCVVRTLKINSKAGVRYMEKYVAERKAPIEEYIPDEDLVLEKVENGPGMYPSVLPIGA